MLTSAENSDTQTIDNKLECEVVKSCVESADGNTISKRRQKKILKIKNWEAKKKEKRLKEREKYRLKRLDAIAKGMPTRIGPSRKALKHNKIDDSECSLAIAVDLSFDELMIDKDVSKCVKQCLRVYTLNRRSTKPVQLYFTGIKEGGRVHQTLEKNDGYQNWDVKLKFDCITNFYDKDKIVYLTSESDNVLTELENDKVYVIGGLVDHNQHKGLCHKKAEDLNIKHARLPLSENVVIKTRTVLTIDHVFEILLGISEGQNWQETILKVIPTRKGAIPIEKQIE